MRDAVIQLGDDDGVLTITAAMRLIETRFFKDAIMRSSCGACESRSTGFFQNLAGDHGTI
jgi:hypothetical protein